MATVNDTPKRLSMNDLRSQALMYDSLQVASRFAVRITPVGSVVNTMKSLARDFTYLCETTDLPGRSFDTIPIRYYGPQEYFPILSNYNNSEAGFTFLCRNQAFEREFFDTWMAMINPPNTFDFRYRDDYKAEIDIYQFSDTGVEQENQSSRERWKIKLDQVANYKITLKEAWPINLMSQPLNWSDNEFTRLTVTFSYVKWIRKGIDQDAGPPYDFRLHRTAKDVSREPR